MATSTVGMSRSLGDWTHPGISLDGRTLALFVGDLAAIFAILAVGLLSHGVDPIASLDHAIQTALPFLIGWTLVAPIIGVYDETVRRSLGLTIGGTTLAWIGASLAGALIRASEYFHGGAPAVFIAVTIGTGLLIMIPWRIAVAFLLSR